MKKIIIILFICLGFAKAKAQTFHSYADTANYLINEIEVLLTNSRKIAIWNFNFLHQGF